MTSGGDAEVLRTWLQRMCCTLAIPASSYFGGLRDRETEVWQRLELPEGRGDRGDRGEFTGSIQDDIQTEGQSPQRAEYLYFTLDMYSNWEAEERHSGEVAKCLRMTNGWVTYTEQRSVISVTDQKVNGTQLWVIRSNLKWEQGKQEQKQNGSIQ